MKHSSPACPLGPFKNITSRNNAYWAKRYILANVYIYMLFFFFFLSFYFFWIVYLMAPENMMAGSLNWMCVLCHWYLILTLIAFKPYNVTRKDVEFLFKTHTHTREKRNTFVFFFFVVSRRHGWRGYLTFGSQLTCLVIFWQMFNNWILINSMFYMVLGLAVVRPQHYNVR